MKMLARAGPNGDPPHSHTINVFIEFIVKLATKKHP